VPEIHEHSDVARRVREARLAAGLSQSGLAVVSGVTTTTISRTECESTTPGLHTLEKLARGLGMELAQLLNGGKS
jgi:transcriptional regulator with XRE-family HTH domain